MKVVEYGSLCSGTVDVCAVDCVFWIQKPVLADLILSITHA